MNKSVIARQRTKQGRSNLQACRLLRRPFGAPRNDGSILIASLWALSLFSVLVANVGFQGSQHALLMKRELQSFERKAHFYNAFYQRSQSILEDPEPHEDSPLDSWYGDVTDEESKLNLNFAEKIWLEVFLKLFSARGGSAFPPEADQPQAGGGEEKASLQGERKDFVKALLKKRMKGRIASLEELYLLEGIEKGDVEKLRPFLTVYPEFSQININTADPLVLESLIESLPGDSFAKKELFRRVMEHRSSLRGSEVFAKPKQSTGSQIASASIGTQPRNDVKDGPFRSDELEPPLFMQKLGLTPSLPMVTLVNQLLPFLTTDSRTYRMRIKTETGSAEAVFRERAGKPGMEVLSWHES